MDDHLGVIIVNEELGRIIHVLALVACINDHRGVLRGKGLQIVLATNEEEVLSFAHIDLHDDLIQACICKGSLHRQLVQGLLQEFVRRAKVWRPQWQHA